jgi:protein associated with RNAse G/E
MLYCSKMSIKELNSLYNRQEYDLYITQFCFQKLNTNKKITIVDIQEYEHSSRDVHYMVLSDQCITFVGYIENKLKIKTFKSKKLVSACNFVYNATK